ncbi:uncharacterized protein [Periplaneta americana]
MDSHRDLLSSDPSEEDTSSENSLPSPCIFKLLQVIITIVCMGLYSEGMQLVVYSITSQLFPYIVCSIYLVITPVILLSYCMGQKMPELMIRVFNTLAGILFLVAGVVIMQGYKLHTLVVQFQDYDDVNTEDEILQYDGDETKKNGVFLLASGILCFANCIIYFADVAWSVHTTLANL